MTVKGPIKPKEARPPDLKPNAAQPAARGVVGASTSATTPIEGVKVGAEWEVVEADDILNSYRPGYNMDLQDRNRGVIASEDQVSRIQRQMEPQRLGATVTSDLGAPFINSQNMVLSGNGRSEAIRRRYRSELTGKICPQLAD